MDLAAELQRIYDSEINIRISWLWDGGIEVRLGDEMNGFLAEETVKSASEIAVATGSHRAFQPTVDVRTIPRSCHQATRSHAVISVAEYRGADQMHALRSAPCGPCRDGGGFHIRLPPLREQRGGGEAEGAVELG
jgi:hypothetical protein